MTSRFCRITVRDLGTHTRWVSRRRPGGILSCDAASTRFSLSRFVLDVFSQDSSVIKGSRAGSSFFIPPFGKIWALSKEGPALWQRMDIFPWIKSVHPGPRRNCNPNTLCTIHMLCCPQMVVCKPAALASPGGLVEMQILRPLNQIYWIRSLGLVGPTPPKFENYWAMPVKFLLG